MKRRSHEEVHGAHHMVIDRASQKVIGSYYYEPGVGVFARREHGQQAAFLTHGYRAAIGSEVVSYNGRPGDIAKAKRLAREFVEGF